MKIEWETEIDTPATIAIIGGGAIGIEAALYARFLGYYVTLVEAGRMAQSWRAGAHWPMPCHFGAAASPLGLAALEAHQADKPLPRGDETLTGRQFVENYLIPLAKTDLLIDSVHVHSRVVSVSRLEVRRETPGDIQDRADVEFRLAIHSKNRGWFTERADIVLDCSGISLPRMLGPGGGIAMGEIEQADAIDIDLPDLSGKRRVDFASRRILLAGTSLYAYQNLLALIELSQAEPNTRITWVVTLEPGMDQPAALLDRLRAAGPDGARLAEDSQIHAALAGKVESVVVVPALGIERVTNSPDGLAVRLQINEDSTLDIQCDRIVSNVGLTSNWDHAQELRIGSSTILDRPVWSQDTDRDPASDSSALLLADSILTCEPHYYVLGSKSFGLAYERFQLSQGQRQIREAFRMIGGRAELDLYSSIERPGR